MPLDYLLRRLGVFLIIIWAAATINFLLPRMSGVDPIRQKMMQEAMRGGYVQAGMNQMMEEYSRKFGTDKSLPEQYVRYLQDLSRLDFNYSISYYPKKVIDIIMEGLPWTIALLSCTTLIGFGVGSVFGALLAWPKSPKWLSYLASPLLTLSSVPYYLLGLILIYIFAFVIKWFPLFGGYSPGTIPSFSLPFVADVAWHAALPAASIVLSAVGFWALGMRSMMVTVQGEDYMILAEAKGLQDRTLLWRYAVRNAVLPQATALAIAIGHIVSGAVLVEVVFGFPGIGGILYQAIRNMDHFVIQGIIIMIVFAIATTTLILDLTLPLLDPRISQRRA